MFYNLEKKLSQTETMTSDAVDIRHERECHCRCKKAMNCCSAGLSPLPTEHVSMEGRWFTSKFSDVIAVPLYSYHFFCESSLDSLIWYM